MSQMMRAVVLREFGGPEKLRLEQVPAPSPQSLRAAESSRSAGHESTMACRAGAGSKEMRAPGKWRSTSAPISPAETLKARML